MIVQEDWTLQLTQSGWKPPTIEDLVGKTFARVINNNDESLDFLFEDGTGFIFHHEQDCCESVIIEDVVGDLSDLAGVPILHAEESVSGDNPEDAKKKEQDSFTWTFYHFRTIKGTVTVRWYGESNGYYSERVDLCRLVDRPAWETLR